MPLTAGQILNNRYRIVTLLGQGGFGAVYRAWDMTLSRPCALKENLDTSAEAQRQFLREAQLLGNLTHPNLPRVIDHFLVPNQGQYLVMDYVEGEDLAQKLLQNGGPLPEVQVIAWIGQVCEALVYLHAQNPPVIHRDIKPANIRITPAGKAMLVDFGIAKIFDPHMQTTVGARAVTPGFSPIEQYGRGRHTDARTDVYALGATLYALLTGEEPVEAPERNLGVALPAPRALNPRISAQGEAAILKAMAVLPDSRFQDVGSFRQALQSANPPAPVTRTPGGTVIVSSQLPHTAIAPSETSGQKPLPWGWIGGAALAGICLFAAALLLGGWLRDLMTGADTPTPSASATRPLATEPPAVQPSPSDTPTGAPTRTSTGAPTHTPTGAPTHTSTGAPTYTPTPTAMPDSGAPMVLIPAGEFIMGEDADASLAECHKLRNDCERSWFEVEEPVHAVYLDAYYIDIYEVTNARYAECVGAGACDPPTKNISYSRASYYDNQEYAGYPLLYVDWAGAQAYCRWRGGDLPSEAQWEKASRGGMDEAIYPWGEQTPSCSHSNFDPANSTMCIGDTAEAGSYPANGYGLYDMAGNVWEWVFDWYLETFYNSSPFENPTGLDSGQSRIVRGGSWSSSEVSLRTANRERDEPIKTFNNIGFRCARLP